MKKFIFLLFTCYNFAWANYNIFDHVTIQQSNLPLACETEHFKLYCTPTDTLACQKILEVAEKNFKQCSIDFNHKYSAKINLHVFSYLQDLHNAVGQPHAEDRVANVYKPEDHSFLTVNPEHHGSYHSTESLLNLNMHGLTSLFIYDKYSTKIPFWFTHGIGLWKANYIDKKIVRQLIQNHQLIPSLQQLEDFDSSSDIYRACSYLMVEFINHQWGWDKILALLADHTSFEKILEVSKEKFKDQFIDYLDVSHSGDHMINFIPFSQTHTKHSDPSCTVSEYIFNQPSVDIAQAIIKGRHPFDQNKKAVNLTCDFIYFVLEGQCIVHTAQGSYTLNQQDALFIIHGSWYWVESTYAKILVVSAPAWNAEQYKEI